MTREKGVDTVVRLAHDHPLVVIGDVHGESIMLNALLTKLRRELADLDQRRIVFVGDLIDRGPDSARVIDTVAGLGRTRPNTTAIMGNHELALSGALGIIPVPESSNWAERYLRSYESASTFASYGVEPGDLHGLHATMPEGHKALLASLPWVVEHAEFLVVHAGLDPAAPVNDQLRLLRRRAFSLNRPTWLCEKALVNADAPPACPFTVISGHVPVDLVILRERRILIDTGCGRGGCLSAIALPERRVISVP